MMLPSLQKKKLLGAGVFALLLPIVIISLVTRTNTSSSASVTTSLEAESGVLVSNATQVNDTLASGGKFVVLPGTLTQNTASIRNDGMIILNGVALYPLGFYHDSDDGRQGQYLADDLKTIAGTGYNTMHPVVTELANTTQYRDLAPKLGVWTIASFYKPALTSTVTALKDDKSIFAWDIADDFSSPVGNPRLTPDMVKALHDQIKKIAPNHLTYGAAGTDQVYQNEKYLGTMDVMGMENYPVGNNYSDYTTEMEYSIALYIYQRKNLGNSQSILALPQTFMWPGQRYPTAQELRNMSYGALIARMNGVVYYTYIQYGPVSNTLPVMAPALWAEAAKMPSDLSKLTPALLNGTYTQYDSACATCSKNPGRIHAAFYQYSGKTYVIIVNTATSTQTASIPLPSGVTGILTSLFPTDSRYISGLSLVGGKISGLVPSYGVGVYKLE